MVAHQPRERGGLERTAVGHPPAAPPRICRDAAAFCQLLQSVSNLETAVFLDLDPTLAASRLRNGVRPGSARLRRPGAIHEAVFADVGHRASLPPDSAIVPYWPPK